ncbi:MAG: hypothetical protein K2J40_11445 [Ruminococcus sp.]|nr:hypothetical protein [Ruminococcus sp.]
MFRKIITAVLALTVIAGCSEKKTVEDIPAESSVISHTHTEPAQLCMDNVKFISTFFHNHQLKVYNDTDVIYYFVVLNDGNVFTMEKNYKSDNYEFHKKIFSCDDSAWETADNIENIGTFSPKETETLSGYIAGINPDSDYYDRERDDMGMAPDVIESVYYSYYCYIPNGEKKSVFRVMSFGENQGTS